MLVLWPSRSRSPPIAQIKAGALSGPSSMTERPSSCSTSPQHKKATFSKKRKEPSATTTAPSPEGETIAVEPFSPLRKIKRVEWVELELFDPPADVEFDF